MRLIIKQTSCDEVVGRARCAVCSGRFHLGPATCEAVSDDGVNLGQVCPRCLEDGPEVIQKRLEQTEMDEQTRGDRKLEALEIIAVELEWLRILREHEMGARVEDEEGSLWVRTVERD